MLRDEPGVYKITNIINGKVYIGSSFYLLSRTQTHFSSLQSNSHFNRHLQGAVRQHGLENFRVDVIEYTPRDLVRQREAFWIEQFRACDPRFGYNKIPEDRRTAETFEKIRRSLVGKRLSKETIEKRRQARLGTRHSDTTRQKMSESRGQFWSSEAGQIERERRQTRIVTDQTRQTRSEKLKAYYQTPEGQAKKSRLSKLAKKSDSSFNKSRESR